MNAHFDSVPLQLSALQLAWMHELGIEKHWIPAPPSQPKQVLTLEAAVAPAASATVVSTVASTVVSAETEKRAAAAPTLEALSQVIASCQACGLCLERERVVVGQGVMQAAVMVVGEGPGEQEDRQGEPFVGRSGMLLDRMLSTIDSSREKNVYLTNIIKCRPPGNRRPRPEEIAACKPYLLRQIELVKPRSMFALGQLAAQSLLGVQAPLALMREQAYTLPHPGHTVPVVVSYHPAYLLRKATEKAAAWKDLNQLRAWIA